MGYTLDEVKGKHHSLFVTPAYRESAEYRAFWAKLGRGEYDAEQYQAHRQGRPRSVDSGILQSHRSI
jgi:methyl-accepting chemotaxis protein